MHIIKTLDFFTQYDKVFKDDVVVNCGREECKKLIDIAMNVGKDLNLDYGNLSTGAMNIKNIQKLKNHLSNI